MSGSSSKLKEVRLRRPLLSVICYTSFFFVLPILQESRDLNALFRPGQLQVLAQRQGQAARVANAQQLLKLDAHETNSSSASPSSAAAATLVDCSTVETINPVNIGMLQALPYAAAAAEEEQQLQYPVSFSWWDPRIHQQPPKQKYHYGNANVDIVARTLATTKGALIDVGANVGFMTNLALYAMNHNRTVYAIEPVYYNVAKICDVYRQQQASATSGQLYLYHAAAGSTMQAKVTVHRPSSRIGYFDQTSLSQSNVYQNELAREIVPMITVDSVLFGNHHNDNNNINDDHRIAMVKIDVQGYEHAVIQGMHQLLSRARTHGYPSVILYESDPAFMVQGTGRTPLQTQTLVESYGYTCQDEDELGRQRSDTLCTLLL